MKLYYNPFVLGYMWKHIGWLMDRTVEVVILVSDKTIFGCSPYFWWEGKLFSFFQMVQLLRIESNVRLVDHARKTCYTCVFSFEAG